MKRVGRFTLIFSLLAAGCASDNRATLPAALQRTAVAQRGAERKAPPLIATLGLSDTEEQGDGNVWGFHPSIAHGPKPTLGENVVWFCEGAAERAKQYGAGSLYVWTGFGGSRFPRKGDTTGDDNAGYVPDVLDAAPGISLAHVRACAAAIAAKGVRPGIIVRPQQIVQGVNRPKVDGSNPVGQLRWQFANARACGFMDPYVDSGQDELYAVGSGALDPARFGQFTSAFPDTTVVVEFYADGYPANVLHWCKSANFKSDHPRAVEFTQKDLDSPAKVKAWGKRLKDTGSTAIVNVRPDDSTLPQSQAPVVAAYKAAYGSN